MRVASAVFILSLCFLCFLYLLAPVVNAGLSWNTQAVDENSDGSYCSLALDSANQPHIAYTDVRIFWNQQYYHLLSVMYASWNGTGWDTQKVADGRALSLVLDAKGIPSILYTFEGSLIYTSFTGSNWTSQLVDANGGGYGVIALDNQDIPHVAYISSNRTIKYASLAGSNWESIIIDENQLDNPTVSLAIDKNSIAYVLYAYDSTYSDIKNHVDLSSKIVKVAKESSPSWIIDNASLPLPVSSVGNIVVDSRNVPNFIYTHFNIFSAQDRRLNSTLFYASMSGSSWTSQAVYTGGSNINGFLTLDNLGNPHIIIASGVYASWTGQRWNIQNLGFTVDKPNLAIESNNILHLCYFASSTQPYISYLNYAEGTQSSAELAFIQTITLSSTAIIASIIIISILLVRRHRKTANLKK